MILPLPHHYHDTPIILIVLTRATSPPEKDLLQRTTQEVALLRDQNMVDTMSKEDMESGGQKEFMTAGARGGHGMTPTSTGSM